MTERYHQPFLSQLEPSGYPGFREVTRNTKQLQQNLDIASVLPTDSQFLYYERRVQHLLFRDKIAQTVERAIITDSEQSMELDQTDLDEFVELLPMKCECGNPATTAYFCENCGGEQYCSECSESSKYWRHMDHDCSGECCVRNHRAEILSEAELESIVPKVETSAREVRKTKRYTVFLINVRKRTPEEVEALKIEIASYYHISDWPRVTRAETRDGMLEETIEGDLTKPYLRTICQGIRILPSWRTRWHRIERREAWRRYGTIP